MAQGNDLNSGVMAFHFWMAGFVIFMFLIGSEQRAKYILACWILHFSLLYCDAIMPCETVIIGHKLSPDFMLAFFFDIGKRSLGHQTKYHPVTMLLVSIQFLESPCHPKQCWTNFARFHGWIKYNIALGEVETEVKGWCVSSLVPRAISAFKMVGGREEDPGERQVTWPQN